MKAIRLLTVAAGLIVGGSAEASISTGFESLTGGAQYTLGAYIHSDDLNFRVSPQSISSIRVGTSNQARGGGNELMFTDRGSLQFILPGGVDSLSFRFGSFASQNRFTINGATHSLPTSFNQANGLIVGGVTIGVALDSGSNVRGVTTLTGPIQSFTLTGTELWIDNVVVDAVPTNADFDGDGDVDGSDLLRWQSGLRSAGASMSQGDADSDADVDGADLIVWRGKFGELTPTMIPEPSALALAALAAAGLLARRARRSQ
jgi:hypothetical protein